MLGLAHHDIEQGGVSFFDELAGSLQEYAVTPGRHQLNQLYDFILIVTQSDEPRCFRFLIQVLDPAKVTSPGDNDTYFVSHYGGLLGGLVCNDRNRARY
jgi:hypothetical protein